MLRFENISRKSRQKKNNIRKGKEKKKKTKPDAFIKDKQQD